MRIIFMGTAEFAVPALKVLIEHGHDIVAVYTAPPKPQGRKYIETKTPIHLLAEEYGLKVLTPTSLKNGVEEFKSFNPDVAVVAAYGLLLRQDILDAPKYGCLNIHPSLLPRWRGAAPIQRTIEAGDKESAVCIMQMDAGLDTGAIVAQENFAVNQKYTSQDLHDFAAQLGAKLLVQTLDNIKNLKPKTQSEEGVTYAAKVTKEEGLIDFTLDAETIERKTRAFFPWPSCYFNYKGEMFKILEAEVVQGSGKAGEVLSKDLHIACGKDALAVKKIQRQGKKPLAIEELVRGFEFVVGDVISKRDPESSSLLSTVKK